MKSIENLGERKVARSGARSGAKRSEATRLKRESNSRMTTRRRSMLKQRSTVLPSDVCEGVCVSQGFKSGGNLALIVM